MARSVDDVKAVPGKIGAAQSSCARAASMLFAVEPSRSVSHRGPQVKSDGACTSSTPRPAHLRAVRRPRAPRHDGDGDEKDGVEGESAQVGGVEGGVHGLGQQVAGFGWQRLGQPQRRSIPSRTDGGSPAGSTRTAAYTPAKRLPSMVMPMAPPSSNATSSAGAVCAVVRHRPINARKISILIA